MRDCYDELETRCYAQGLGSVSLFDVAYFTKLHSSSGNLGNLQSENKHN